MLIYNNWETYFLTTNNDAKVVEFSFPPRNIQGVKILMKKAHPKLGLFEGKPIFGIKKIEVHSGNKDIRVKKCNEGDAAKTNRWELVDSSFMGLNFILIDILFILSIN